MARLPQALATFRARFPGQPRRAVFPSQLFCQSHRFIHHGPANAMKLEQKRWPLGQIEMRIAVHRGHHPVIHKLDAGHAEAKLDRFDYGFNRILHGWKRANCNRDSLWQRMQPQRHFSDDAKRSFGAHKQVRKVVSGAGFASACAGVDDAAVGKDDGKSEHVFAHSAERTAVVPEARVEAMPPMVASAPGSMKNVSPVFSSAFASCMRLTPASTVASRSAELTRSTRFICRMSMQMPPRVA